jgi:DNA polymerase III subunit delta
VITQLSRWRGRKLERLIDRLTALHASLMANSQNAELLLSQELAGIARAAARRG